MGIGRIQWVGGNVTVNNAVVSSGAWSVTISKTVVLNNLTQTGSATSEIDKDIDQITFNGGSVVNNLSFQSASIHKVTLNSISIDNLEGTTQDTVCNGATIGDLVAGTGYGAAGRFQGTNCHIGNVSHVALNAYGNVVNDAGWSIAGGVFTNAIAIAAPPRWGVPGTNMLWNGALDYEGQFTISDISENDPNFSVSTSLSGGFPRLPLEAGTGNLIIVADPYPNWVVFLLLREVLMPSMAPKRARKTHHSTPSAIVSTLAPQCCRPSRLAILGSRSSTSTIPLAT